MDLNLPTEAPKFITQQQQLQDNHGRTVIRNQILHGEDTDGVIIHWLGLGHVPVQTPAGVQMRQVNFPIDCPPDASLLDVFAKWNEGYTHAIEEMVEKAKDAAAAPKLHLPPGVKPG